MTLDDADICGITEADIKSYFPESVSIVAKARSISEEACYQRLAKMYDGYRFHPDAEGVYNPYSLLRCLKSRDFGEYWFETGPPGFLIRFIQ